MRILAVCGSLQARSANLALLNLAIARAAADVTVVLFDGLRDLPHFNPDLEATGTPPAVQRWRDALAGSDAVLIASPEYGHSLPGALKNGIDWVIGSGELEGKIVAITAVVPHVERGRRGLQALRDTLGAVSAMIVGGEPIVRGPDFERQVEDLMSALVAATTRSSGADVRNTGARTDSHSIPENETRDAVAGRRLEPVHIEPFTIHVPDDVLTDLRARIERTRWPEPAPGAAWEQGTDLEYVRRLVRSWADDFDWRVQERQLNTFKHFRAELGEVHVHFVHERAREGDGIPLILTHGWPSSFLELLPLVPLLTNPRAHGIDAPGFDLVLPSLPGYGFSDRPARANYRVVARLWHTLMLGLGYARYGAGGGDFGAGVATHLALDYPASVTGIHLTTPEMWPPVGEGSRPLTEAEREYVSDVRRWDEVERGYSAIQSTRPQTLGYALSDSPAGLAAWIVEKWRAWSDCNGDLEGRVSRDFLLTMLTLYWVTNTITPSMRDYFDNRWHRVALEVGARVPVPMGFANFARSYVSEGSPPREWLERLYDVRRWTSMPRGGHFGAVEEPVLLARDIAAFFAERRR